MRRLDIASCCCPSVAKMKTKEKGFAEPGVFPEAVASPFDLISAVFFISDQSIFLPLEKRKNTTVADNHIGGRHG